ncbi:MAG: hypothetical protein FJW99_01130 [Actinobacteria bacterium]|nr:hypothetical protein [Actinomycetota bacterium]
MTHFYPGGTAEQHAEVLEAVHADRALPPDRLLSPAGPTDGGWLISAVRESRAAFETFAAETLMPALVGIDGDFATAPEERLAECTLFHTATATSLGRSPVEGIPGVLP